jgi:hypothetical protein
LLLPRVELVLPTFKLVIKLLFCLRKFFKTSLQNQQINYVNQYIGIERVKHTLHSTYRHRRSGSWRWFLFLRRWRRRWLAIIKINCRGGFRRKLLLLLPLRLVSLELPALIVVEISSSRSATTSPATAIITTTKASSAIVEILLISTPARLLVLLIPLLLLLILVAPFLLITTTFHNKISIKIKHDLVN